MSRLIIEKINTADLHIASTHSSKQNINTKIYLFYEHILQMYRNYKTINKYKSLDHLHLLFIAIFGYFKLIAKNCIACKEICVNLFPIHFSYISLKFHPYVCTTRPVLICIELLGSEFRHFQRFKIDRKISLSFFKDLRKKEMFLH